MAETYTCKATEDLAAGEAKTYPSQFADEYWHTVLAFEHIVAVDCRNADELEADGAVDGALHLPCRMAEDPNAAVAAAAASLPDDHVMPMIARARRPPFFFFFFAAASRIVRRSRSSARSAAGPRASGTRSARPATTTRSTPGASTRSAPRSATTRA